MATKFEMGMIKVFFLMGVVLIVACETPSTAPPPFVPVGDVQQLMEMVIDPAADIVWESVGTIVTLDGTEEIFPRSDEEWSTVRNSAMVLAESGNLLMVGDRSKGEGPWMIMSQALVEAGMVALEAAESKDPEAVFAVGEQIYNACETCHVLYWYTEEDAVIR
ncbi:MAG: hypothetical protein VX338_05685 [Acidobacteriota bacterium]|nr:hypothetical protein [Acidobacteriota bacterium]MCS5703185.1 hypothetical protein [Acidobacteriota bacterium]MEE2610129.1 hypothetical protein [Acidobacteriota bacterium]MEE3138829.1 hypothetical protein [Acidobacteriota bacterium]